MKTRNVHYLFVLMAVLLGFAIRSVAQEQERAYSMEGAWYGTVTIPDVGLTTPSLDTYTANSTKHGVEGTFLCTIPSVGKMPNPGNENGWLAVTPAGHGNWVRIAKNKYAFTAVRTIFDENGNLFGWGKYWGTITPVSDDEYTGEMHVQYFLPDGTPFTPVFPGVMHSQRMPIISEQ